MTDNSQESQSFPIVAIVVAAKDTEALQQFFSQVLQESWLSYIVLITSPFPEGALTSATLQCYAALEHYASLPITIAADKEVIVPNHIYLIPPQASAYMIHQRIQLEPLGETLSPLDRFFHSLARTQGNKAAGVILSGAENYGTSGLKAIKFQDGLVLVQLEATAYYPTMPRSAILTGTADAILPPDQILSTIEQYFQNQESRSQLIKPESVEAPQEWLQEIFALLRSRIGHDFSAYKRNTLMRRITRRMNVQQIERYEDYTQFLQENPEEIKALFRECLIGVTSFFRDAPAFEALKEQYLPPLLNSLSEGETFRAWIPACSTGEEVYSLAIILQEIIDGMNKHINLQLFGTDIDQLAIEKAREGIFPPSIQTEISPERLDRFFEQEAQFYKIKSAIRNIIIFSMQDVLKDPPFSHLHLLSCRNLLIYLDGEMQQQVLPIFHYTLNRSGILMLGSSESIGDFQNLFYPLDHRWKIFKRRDIQQLPQQPINFPTRSQFDLTSSDPATSQESNLKQLVEEKLLEEFSPTAILIETNGVILHIQGRTGKFLEMVSGVPSNNIIDLAREGLKFELSSAIRAVVSSGQSVTRNQIKIHSNSTTELVTLQIKPLSSPQLLAGRLLVIIKLIDSNSNSETDQDSPEDISLQKRDNRIAELEKELQETRENHKTTIEELESSNEELQVANEELESSNEELQATNEELESSKEELQSVNEELQTLNQELQSTVDELSVAQDDLRNLLNITEIAAIIVDNQMRVKRFTPEITYIIPLIATDIGRPIHHVTTNLDDDGMVGDILEVLQTLNSKEKVVQTREGIWYRMEITPYRKENYQVEGVVVKFININELQQKEQALEQARLLQQSLLNLHPQPIIVLNDALEIIATNQALQDKLTTSQVEEYLITPLRTRLQNNDPLHNVSIEFTISSEIQYHFFVNTLVMPTPENPIKYLVLSLTEFE